MEAPTARYDPIPHRIHKWLFVPAKRTFPCENFTLIVSEWISTVYGAEIEKRCRPAVEAMNNARGLVVQMSQATIEMARSSASNLHDAFDKTYFPATASYINSMRSLLKKTAGTSSEQGLTKIKFVWRHFLADDGNDTLPDILTGSLRMEVLCVLFNAAAICSILGSTLPPGLRSASHVTPATGGSILEPISESEECLKYRCRRFRTSAILFDQIAMLARHWALAKCDEIDADVCTVLSRLMLAQAQEVAYVIHIFFISFNFFAVSNVCSISLSVRFFPRTEVLSRRKPRTTLICGIFCEHCMCGWISSRSALVCDAANDNWPLCFVLPNPSLSSIQTRRRWQLHCVMFDRTTA